MYSYMCIYIYIHNYTSLAIYIYIYGWCIEAFCLDSGTVAVSDVYHFQEVAVYRISLTANFQTKNL